MLRCECSASQIGNFSEENEKDFGNGHFGIQIGTLHCLVWTRHDEISRVLSSQVELGLFFLVYHLFGLVVLVLLLMCSLGQYIRPNVVCARYTFGVNITCVTSEL